MTTEKTRTPPDITRQDMPSRHSYFLSFRSISTRSRSRHDDGKDPNTARHYATRHAASPPLFLVFSQYFDSVTVMFTYMDGFAHICSRVSAMQAVNLVNSMFIKFDALTEEHDVYKVPPQDTAGTREHLKLGSAVIERSNSNGFYLFIFVSFLFLFLFLFFFLLLLLLLLSILLLSSSSSLSLSLSLLLLLLYYYYSI